MTTLDNTSIEVLRSDLQYPEGPVHCSDGSIILVELKGQCVTMISPDGSSIQKIASMQGSPNGTAVGPDGQLYICNSGGFDWIPIPLPNGQTILVTGNQPSDYIGGRLQKVDLLTGSVTDLYTQCQARQHPPGTPAADWNPAYKLCGLDDIVFDDAGGMWFTDYGKNREKDSDITGLYYATADGKSITQVVYPLSEPNGIALSPCGKKLYVALTFERKVIYFDITEPGVIKPNPADIINGSHLLTSNLKGQSVLDSMAVDSEGNVYVATMLPEGNNPMSNGGISVISADGSNVDFVPIILPNNEFAPLPSNICFGGQDMKTAYITCGGSGHLITMRSSIAGLKLHHNGSAFDNSKFKK